MLKSAMVLLSDPAANARPAPAGDDPRWTIMLDDGLRVEATDDPDSPVLDRFFAGYDRAFILPDEREEIEGFRACMALNETSRHRFGRTHAELVLTVQDGAGGVLLGGANFLATAMPAIPGHPPVAVALNYVFVEEAARGRGLSRRLLAAVGRLANRALGLADEECWPAMFIEQNDPLLLSAEAYAADTARSGTDQVDRLLIWERLGARLVDFPYVQPPLSGGQQPDPALAYAAVDFPGERVAARFLHDHLESFFGISVLKGGDPAECASAAHQLGLLDAMAAAEQEIALLPMTDALGRLQRDKNWPRGTPLRDYARG